MFIFNKHHRTAPERASKLVPPEVVLTSDLLGAAGDIYLWLSESTDLGVSTHEHIHIEEQSHMFAVVDKNLAITEIQILNHEIKTLNLILQPVKSTIKNRRLSNHYKWSNNIFWFFSYVCNKYQQFIVKKVLRKPSPFQKLHLAWPVTPSFVQDQITCQCDRHYQKYLTCSVQFSLRFRNSTKRFTTPGVEITSSMGGFGSATKNRAELISHWI